MKVDVSVLKEEPYQRDAFEIRKKDSLDENSTLNSFVLPKRLFLPNLNGIKLVVKFLNSNGATFWE